MNFYCELLWWIWVSNHTHTLSQSVVLKTAPMWKRNATRKTWTLLHRLFAPSSQLFARIFLFPFTPKQICRTNSRNYFWFLICVLFICKEAQMEWIVFSFAPKHLLHFLPLFFCSALSIPAFVFSIHLKLWNERRETKCAEMLKRKLKSPTNKSSKCKRAKKIDDQTRRNEIHIFIYSYTHTHMPGVHF